MGGQCRYCVFTLGGRIADNKKYNNIDSSHKVSTDGDSNNVYKENCNSSSSSTDMCGICSRKITTIKSFVTCNQCTFEISYWLSLKKRGVEFNSAKVQWLELKEFVSRLKKLEKKNARQQEKGKQQNTSSGNKNKMQTTVWERIMMDPDLSQQFDQIL